VLKVENLTVRYGAAVAVRNVSFTVAPGKIVGMIGANGAGKTTVLSAVSGLIESTGAIYLDDLQISGLRTDEIVSRRLVQVPQGRQLFPQMSVLENLQIGSYLQPAEMARKRLAELMRRFPVLNDRAEQHAGTLSGGEQQIVAIARGLMANPRILLLDEPCFGLSPIMIKRIASVIRELQNDGLTILLAEQNASFAFGLADEILRIENGTLAFSGSVDEMRSNKAIKSSYLGI
jgi:branched-chain amino acid transport system ATP-binding protein